MPTKREREYYRLGFFDGQQSKEQRPVTAPLSMFTEERTISSQYPSISKSKVKPRRKLSDWQKFIKANSSKKKFKFANGKLKLKSMGIAYRKTAAYKRNKKK